MKKSTYAIETMKYHICYLCIKVYREDWGYSAAAEYLPSKWGSYIQSSALGGKK